MKRLFLFLIVCLTLSTTLLAQKQDESPLLLKTTYPVDSCLYLMDPMDLRVNQQRPLGGGVWEYQVLFRSSSSSSLDYIVRGTGRIYRDSLFLATYGPIGNGDRLQIVASLPDTVEDPDGGWLGGALPFPTILNGFIQEVAGRAVSPPSPLILRVSQYEIIPLSD